MEKNKLNLSKEFEWYQEKLKENRKNIVNEFLNGLVKYNIDLTEIDKLIVRREDGRFLVNNIISQSVNGVESELFSITNPSYSKTEILRDVFQRKVIEEDLGIIIRYKKEHSSLGTIEIWIIDCIGIK